MLSYKGLPHFLKPCLLYFGMFPENSLMESNQLLKLWIAEDFIKGDHGVTVEDVAKGYLLELIQRNLVQISAQYDCGRIRTTVRVHDLIHEVHLRQKIRELNLCQILMVDKGNQEVDVQCRRLSVQNTRLNNALSSISNTASKCKIRALFLFEAEESTTTPLLCKSLVKKFSLLKVLDLQAAPIEQIPKEVGNLLPLQYLSLRFTRVKSIPKTIGKLTNLLTLDLKRCPICELPIEVGNLRKLRHLIVYQNSWHDTLKKWQVGPITVLEGALGRLENLQKLADVNVASSHGFMDQLAKLMMLKYLAISNVKQEHSWTLCKAIERLTCLESLNISVDDDPLDLRHVKNPPLQLQRLYLIGPLAKFPKWIERLENLKKLRFKGSKLNNIPFDILKDLPNLTMLGINKGAYYGEILVIQAGGFKKLKVMYFNSLNLETLVIQPGALPVLEDVTFHRSPKLKEVPNGLQFLGNLTSLKMVEMPEEFVGSISSHPDIVKHVADIRVGYQTSS